MPPYDRFLKSLCTTMRVVTVCKKAFLAYNASSIISHQISVKYKGSNCPTIFIVIEAQLTHKALLSLGASVIVLPYTKYEMLRLRELKLTMVIQLAGGSTRSPKGVVEDLLIKVGEFIYPVDFVMLETKKVVNTTNQINVIPRHPFLAIANCLINYRNGMMGLSFGNMTL